MSVTADVVDVARIENLHDTSYNRACYALARFLIRPDGVTEIARLAIAIHNAFRFSEREAGSKTEMGLAASWQVTEGYHARVSGGLCTEYYGQETSDVCFKQP